MAWPSHSSRSTAKTVAKVVLSVGLIAVLLGWADLSKMGGALMRVPAALLLFALAWWGFDQLLGAWGWNILLRRRGIREPFGRIASLYFTTGFYGFFLPSSMGPDLLRAAALARGTTSGAEAAGSILMLRFLTLLSMPVPFAIGAVLAAGEDGAGIWIAAGLAGFVSVLAAGGMAAAVYRLGRDGRARSFIDRHGLAGRVARFLVDVGHALAAYGRERRILLGVGAIMAFTQIARILLAYVLALGMGSPADLAYFFLTLPVVSFIVKLPISIGGLGIGEGGLVVGFLQGGMAYEEALALALVLSFLSLAVALAGGGIALLRPDGVGKGAAADLPAR
jgi:uncharacterized protein (TIRG00374 family)